MISEYKKSDAYKILHVINDACCFVPVTSPFRLKFLKFFQIRYLESQNVLTVPDRAYKAY